MDRVMDEVCCAFDQHAHDDGTTIALRAPDCCERHALSRLPKITAPSTTTYVLTTPLVAVLPAPTAVLVRRAPTTAARIDREGRAGPRASDRHRAELMVSLS
jgi:hypothetical protein